MRSPEGCEEDGTVLRLLPQGPRARALDLQREAHMRRLQPDRFEGPAKGWPLLRALGYVFAKFSPLLVCPVVSKE